jgi:hypothetical protein
MAYNMTKKDMIGCLKEDAEYFPFEQIRSFELLQKQPFGIAEDVKADYLTFFADVKRECEYLLQVQPESENGDLWKEAVDLINKILK